MLCHGNALLCGKKMASNSVPCEGNESEGEDMYGFLPKRTAAPRSAVRCENIYGPNPRRSATRKVTFLEEPPKVRVIRRRHSCAENFRSYAVRQYNYQPLIPVERLPSYPNHSAFPRRTGSWVGRSGYGDRRPVQRPARPPCYREAVSRAASFSTTRSMNQGTEVLRHPSVDTAKCSTVQSSMMAPVYRQLSTSTSDLYVDSLASLKRSQSRDLSAGSSTSSISEATVYKKIGPGDYVSMSGKPQRKNFVSSMESSSDDGVDVSFRSSVASSTDLETVNPMKMNNDVALYARKFEILNLEDKEGVELDAPLLGESYASESPHCNQTEQNCLNQCNPAQHVTRIESPDNDSAFSDSVSLFSSESSTSSGTTPANRTVQNPTVDDSEAEKIKFVSQKMNETNETKLLVKIFAMDGCSKSLLIDESMKCGHITKVLADKYRIQLCPKWALVEHLPELHMERVYEEHEPLVENLMQWSRDSKNKLYFIERPERMLPFQKLEYDPTISLPLEKPSCNTLFQEYMNTGVMPMLEDTMYIKMGSKKGWKKYQVVLRACGLYYYKKKTLKFTMEVACLTTLDDNQVYYGIGWKKKFKAPTDHCFAIKHPILQQKKSVKHIKYLCTDDTLTLHKWVTAIRLIKHGRQLVDNYRSLIVQDNELSDSGSSGCDVAFESDITCGTIKRKPAKLPLTATTRQLASLESRTTNTSTLERFTSLSSLPPPPPELLDEPITDEEIDDIPPPPPPSRLLNSLDDDFSQNLQKTMTCNWQVTEKCKQDANMTSQEILGFSDSANRTNSVRNWLAEHYAGGQNLYENIYRGSNQSMQERVSLMPIVKIESVSSSSDKPLNKRPPPPPPRRAVTTQLTTVSANRRLQQF